MEGKTIFNIVMYIVIGFIAISFILFLACIAVPELGVIIAMMISSIIFILLLLSPLILIGLSILIPLIIVVLLIVLVLKD